MLPQESRERIRHFTKLLRIPTIGLDNISVEDLNIINTTLDQINNDLGESYPTPMLMQLKRFLEMSSASLPITPSVQSFENVTNPSIAELKSMIQGIIDYKTNNTP